MSDSCKTYHQNCLYFSANSLSRHINELAEQELSLTGLAPSYVYLLLSVIEEPGKCQNELSRIMNVKASTMTRFIDKLVFRKLVTKEQEGRNVLIYPTKEGNKMREPIHAALKGLFERYCDLLGEDFALKLTENIHFANQQFEK